MRRSLNYFIGKISMINLMIIVLIRVIRSKVNDLDGIYFVVIVLFCCSDVMNKIF